MKNKYKYEFPSGSIVEPALRRKRTVLKERTWDWLLIVALAVVVIAITYFHYNILPEITHAETVDTPLTSFCSQAAADHTAINQPYAPALEEVCGNKN